LKTYSYDIHRISNHQIYSYTFSLTTSSSVARFLLRANRHVPLVVPKNTYFAAFLVGVASAGWWSLRRLSGAGAPYWTGLLLFLRCIYIYTHTQWRYNTTSILKPLLRLLQSYQQLGVTALTSARAYESVCTVVLRAHSYIPVRILWTYVVSSSWGFCRYLAKNIDLRIFVKILTPLVGVYG